MSGLERMARQVRVHLILLRIKDGMERLAEMHARNSESLEAGEGFAHSRDELRNAELSVEWALDEIEAMEDV